MNLDDLLHQASEALTSRTSGATPTDPSHGGPARSVAIVGLGAVFAALVGLAVYGVTQTSDEPDSAAVMADEGADAGAPSEATTPIAAATSEDSAEDNAQLNMSDTDANEVSAAADETASSVPEGAWVSDGVPVDLALTRSVAEAEMGDPRARLGTDVYGIVGQQGPAEGDQQLTITWAIGEAAPPLFGEPVELRGGEGARRGDGALGFADGEFTVWVNSSTIDEAGKIAVAEQVVVGSDGPEPLASPPAGLTYLGSIESLLFDDQGSSVPADGFSTDYSAGQRLVSVMAGPLGGDDASMIFWASAVTMEDIGGRTVAVAFGEPLAQAAWVEDGQLVRVLATGLTKAELDAVVAGTRPASSADGFDTSETASPSIAVEDIPGDTAGLSEAVRVAASAVPEDLRIRASGDHADLGPALFEAQRAVYGPAEGGRSITLSVGPPNPPFPGEVVTVEGVDVVIVDKAAANATVDVTIQLDDRSVSVQGAGMSQDEMLAAARDYIIAGDLAALTRLENGFTVQTSDSIAAWQVGGVILNGPPEGGSILYNDGEEFGRSLQVISSPAAPGGDVGWYQWTHPQTTEVVDIAGISAELIRPAGEWTVVRFVSGERIIEVRGHQLNDDEVLASAATLREATDAEWGVG